MNKLTFVAVCLALSFGISLAMITPSVMGQPTYMNQSGMNMSAPETAASLEIGNDTQVLENDTSIGNPNNTLLNSMETNENQSN
jgi:hypothetical protein